MQRTDQRATTSKERLSRITEEIVSWYARNRRDLPWRNTKDPYRIWVSEIMLQQTQVDTVVPYYERFLSRFPTVHALADASLDDVLKTWENLGYYARARHLHAAAREIVETSSGRIPQTRDELVRLPGIGEYTCGAILSIAFGRPYPAVDANVRRVLSRLFAIRASLDQGRTARHIASVAERLVPVKNPGEFNQGLMDLGATICTPKTPRCAICPVQSCCRALEKGLEEVLPTPKRRPSTPHHNVTAGIMKDGRGRLLIVQRPPRGLLGGLWKLPGGRQKAGESLEACLHREIRQELGLDVAIEQPLLSVNHAYTHFRITLHAFQCRRQKGRPEALDCSGWRWTSWAGLDNLALSRADRKVLEGLKL
jgi:A/G-specific adenine glycosylase